MPEDSAADVPIVRRPDSLPPRWPGGEPCFEINAGFYLAALRGELCHFIATAERLAAMADGPASPVRLAARRGLEFALLNDAEGFVHYAEGFERETAGVVWTGDADVFTPFLMALPEFVVSVKTALRWRDRLARLASPRMLADAGDVAALCPAVEFDFPAPPASSPPAEPVEEAGSLRAALPAPVEYAASPKAPTPPEPASAPGKRKTKAPTRKRGAPPKDPEGDKRRYDDFKASGLSLPEYLRNRPGHGARESTLKELVREMKRTKAPALEDYRAIRRHEQALRRAAERASTNSV